MKLLIDISKNDYEEIKEYGINTFSSLAIAIQNGTPLPKGHGRLIDADKINFDSNYFFNGDDTIIAEETVNDIPTIIEADKEE